LPNSDSAICIAESKSFRFTYSLSLSSKSKFIDFYPLLGGVGGFGGLGLGFDGGEPFTLLGGGGGGGGGFCDIFFILNTL